MTVSQGLLSVLRCPACVPNRGRPPEHDGVLVLEGTHSLVCRSCGARYPIVAGIPDMRLEREGGLAKEQTVDTSRRSG